MTKDEALKLALEALRSAAAELYRASSYCNTYEVLGNTNDAITAIQQARSAPVQEPVAWPVGSAEYHRSLLAMGKALAKERSREIGDAWNQLANLLTVLEKARSATPPTAPVAWKWHQAPVKTSWGHDMVVADLAIDKDNTVSVYCERDQTTKVEAMFNPPAAPVQEPVACQYGNGGYACCEGGPCKADEQNNATPVQEPVWCGHCNGSGRMVRDPDIGTDQECFVCDGAGVPAAPVQEYVGVKPCWYESKEEKMCPKCGQVHAGAIFSKAKPAQPAPVQEPVAWEQYAIKFAKGKKLTYEKPKNLPSYIGVRALVYADTTPPAAQRPFVGLTDEEISAIGSKIFPSTWNTNHVEFARAIEAKLKERNT